MTRHIHTEPLGSEAFLIVTEASTPLGPRAVVQAFGVSSKPRLTLSPAVAHRVGTALVEWAEGVVAAATVTRDEDEG